MKDLAIRHAVLSGLIAVGVWACSAVLVHGYPTQPIRIIAPFPPGTGSDLVARIVADFIASKSGQQVVVENRVGAVGNLGMEAVAKAAPDGHTLGIIPGSSIVINPFLHKHLPLDTTKDLVAIAPIAEATLTIAVNAALPAKTLKEFIDFAKAHPGKLNYGSAGTGSMSHLGAVRFARVAGLELMHVPYRGIVQAVIDLVGGHIQMIAGPIGPVMGSMPSEQLRVLVAFSPQRLPYLPDVPTASEAGLPNYELTTWFGLFAPTGTPKEAVSQLNGYIADMLKEPIYRKRLVDNYLLPMNMSSEQFAKLIASDLVKWKQIVLDAGLEPE
jgi:tripartite-type tricarboxylate transporter receptor subunit TctC